jgi:hypothetical protein
MQRILLLVCFAFFPIAAWAQDSAQTAAPVAPIAPVVLPPEVPPRPPLVAVPQSPNIGMPMPAPTPGKESLAWRARAHQLRLSNNAQQQQIAATYDAAIMTLISALSQSGMRVQTLNSKAGEVLAVPLDGRPSPKLVFVVAEMPPGTVTIKGAAVGNSKTAPASIDAVFRAMTNPQFAGTQRNPK